MTESRISKNRLSIAKGAISNGCFLVLKKNHRHRLTMSVFYVKPSDIHIATGCTRAQRERLDLDQPTKMERASI